MIRVRKSEERGVADFGWLRSRHSFSFGGYHDPDHMGFGPLRVINEDRVAPGGGFDTHGHRDMEIISYVLEGALQHKDSTGGGSVIRPGDVQRMTAGAGILHSEFNHSREEPVHFFQIWILPERSGLEPGYQQKNFPADERTGQLRLVASRDGRDGALTIHQDVNIYSAILPAGTKCIHPIGKGRRAWLQIARGAITLNGQTLVSGDGAAVTDETSLIIAANEPGEILLFDLP